MFEKQRKLVVSYGAGTDSTAMIIKMEKMGIRPDAILFADVGNEHEYTYEYLPIFNQWLASVDFPTITTVSYTPKKFKWHRYQTLAGNCLANRTLPSLAFGRKSCSLKWKGAVLDKWVTMTYGKYSCIDRAIGYDCSPKDTKRFAIAKGKKSETRPNDNFVYPLQDWGIDRNQCKDIIESAGLPQPGKSSCFFCPAKKACELHHTSQSHLRQIVILEANSFPLLTKIKGLWRRESMTDYIRHNNLLPTSWINEVWDRWASPQRKITTNEVLAEDVLEYESNPEPEGVNPIEQYELKQQRVRKILRRESRRMPSKTQSYQQTSLL